MINPLVKLHYLRILSIISQNQYGLKYNLQPPAKNVNHNLASELQSEYGDT